MAASRTIAAAPSTMAALITNLEFGWMFVLLDGLKDYSCGPLYHGGPDFEP